MVVPRLRSLRLTASGRRYRVRPLPGQLLADFEVAADRLAMRWGAVSVVLEHFAGIFGEQAGNTLDQGCRDILAAGTNVQYADSVANRGADWPRAA